MGGKKFDAEMRSKDFQREVVCPTFRWLDCQIYKTKVSGFLNIEKIIHLLEITDSETVTKRIICGQKQKYRLSEECLYDVVLL